MFLNTVVELCIFLFPASSLRFRKSVARSHRRRELNGEPSVPPLTNQCNYSRPNGIVSLTNQSRVRTQESSSYTHPFQIETVGFSGRGREV